VVAKNALHYPEAEIPQFPIYFPRQRRCQAMEHIHGFALPLSSTSTPIFYYNENNLPV